MPDNRNAEQAAGRTATRAEGLRTQAASVRLSMRQIYSSGQFGGAADGYVMITPEEALLFADLIEAAEGHVHDLTTDDEQEYGCSICDALGALKRD